MLLVGALTGTIQVGGETLAASDGDLDAQYAALRNGTLTEAAFTQRLLSGGRAHQNTKESLEALQKYQNQLREPSNNVQLHSEIALLAEMSGQYDIAIENYQRMVDQTALDDSKRYDILLRIAALHFNNGDFPDALGAAQQVMVGATDQKWVHSAYILQTRIEGYAVQFTTAIQKLIRFIEQYPKSPALRLAYLTLSEMHHRVGNTREVDRIQATLTRAFPSSIEANYAGTHGNKNITPLPLPTVLLQSYAHAADRANQHEYAFSERARAITTQPTTASSGNAAVKIQVGSFRNRSYAMSLQTRLGELGLTAIVDRVSQDQEVYHKVLVRATESSYLNVLSVLEEHNMRGFLINF